MKKLRLRCDMCKGRGKMWLSGADYLECPQCFGEKTIECIEQTVQAKVQTVFISGLRPFSILKLPPRTAIGDTLIPRRI